MAVYFVTGKLRQGKGLFCSYMAMQYYRAGLRVASNFLMDTEKLGANVTNPVTVLPAIPAPEHLFELGRGCPEGEMERFGILILDEGGTWLNNPEKGEQAAFLDWFIHSGKLGWDVYIQVQEKSLINKDIFNATGEHLVIVQRKDRIRFPVISDVLEMVAPNKYGVTGTSKGILPHLISAKVYIGSSSYKAKPNETHLFFGKRLYGIHPTNRIFAKDISIREVPVSPKYPDGIKRTDMRCIYTGLSGTTVRRYRRIEKLNALLTPTIGGRMEPIESPKAEQPVHTVSTEQSNPAQDAQAIAQAIKQLDNEEKKKIRNKKLKMYLAVTLFMVGFWWFAWGWLNEHVFGGHEEVAPSRQAQIAQAQTAQTAQISQSAEPVMLAPESFPLSSRWRLSGWLSQSGQGMFILKGSHGLLRYVPSEQPWEGQRTVFILEGERVTFFSGEGETTSNQSKGVPKGIMFSNAQGGK